jgi:hypothetical protein
MTARQPTPTKTVCRSPIASREGLLAYANEHISYEVKMLAGAAIASVSPRTASDELLKLFLDNVIVEAFGHHCRNLIHFLYPEYVGAMDSDVVADHFIPAARLDEWRVARGALPPSLEQARRRANKEMAHLTSQRMDGTPPEKNWDIKGLATLLGEKLQTFAKLAFPDGGVDDLLNSMRRLEVAASRST